MRNRINLGATPHALTFSEPMAAPGVYRIVYWDTESKQETIPSPLIPPDLLLPDIRYVLVKDELAIAVSPSPPVDRETLKVWEGVSTPGYMVCVHSEPTDRFGSLANLDKQAGNSVRIFDFTGSCQCGSFSSKEFPLFEKRFKRMYETYHFLFRDTHTLSIETHTLASHLFNSGCDFAAAQQVGGAFSRLRKIEFMQVDQDQIRNLHTLLYHAPDTLLIFRHHWHNINNVRTTS
eukprot:GDKI01042772.1.p1 GENE.GDKI01042772.1~~GDKI01042772.1.p1  ORF type:complete len:234 (+),score=36.01 GDKI01042772.1:520-1221(+)